MEIIFGAYGLSDADFSELLLTGWMRAVTTSIIVSPCLAA
jgi:hypothetical protein